MASPTKSHFTFICIFYLPFLKNQSKIPKLFYFSINTIKVGGKSSRAQYRNYRLYCQKVKKIVRLHAKAKAQLQSIIEKVKSTNSRITWIRGQGLFFYPGFCQGLLFSDIRFNTSLSFLIALIGGKIICLF